MSPPPAALAPAAAEGAVLLSPLSPSELHEAHLRRQAFFAVVLAAMCIGFSAIFVRLADVGPAAVGFWRLIFALGPTTVWALAEHRAALRRRPLVAGERRALFSTRQFVISALAGLFFGADLVAFHIGLSHTTTANALLLGNLAVVFVLVIGWLGLGERPSRGLLLALALALGGTALIVSRSAVSAPGDAVSVYGDLLCVGAALCYAGYMLMARLVRRGGEEHAPALGGGMVSLIASSVGAVFCLVWAVATGETLLPSSLQGLLAVIGLGLVAHATGQGLTTFALGRLQAGLISVVLLLQIVVGTSLAALLFGEIPSLMVAIGGTMVVAGVVVARPPKPAR
ncbi:DMT family transporter [Ancylobacter radicis]|uniref:DMT family transporter n=1 Tax=Ancylobacter radicis TaxID=2836179 RepID=A0ABS5RA00_9HYPH|nr:DMT family transporter [Ancylobacter radicis]MBS9478100.1 DMT family transporter [Ancylobacter radicis]